MILQYLQNSLTKIICCFPLRKPAASCLPSQDPLTFLQDSGACTNLGHSLNLFSSDKCIKHILCSLHWLAAKFQNKLQLAVLILETLRGLVPVQMKAAQSSAAEPLPAARCPCGAGHGSAGDAALFVAGAKPPPAEGREEQSPRPKPGSELCCAPW